LPLGFIAHDTSPAGQPSTAAAAWRPYDISNTLLTQWSELRPRLAGKIHVFAGELDTFYLQGAVQRFRAEAEKQAAGWCDQFHAADEAYFKNIYYWNTPTTECLDGRGPICKDFDAWTQAWTEITAG